MAKDYMLYTRFELGRLAREDKEKITPTKAKILEQKLLEAGLILLKSSCGTNGAQDNLIVGGNYRKIPREIFENLVYELDLPYFERESYIQDIKRIPNRKSKNTKSRK